MTLSPNTLLGELVDELCSGDLRLKAPSLASPGTTLYMRKPKMLEEATRPNLEKPLSSLLADDADITVTDPVFPGDVSLTLKISFALEDASPR